MTQSRRGKHNNHRAGDAQKTVKNRAAQTPKGHALRDVQRSRRKKERLRRKRRLVFAGLIFVCFVLTIGIVNLFLYKAVSKYPKDSISKNIYIGKVNVSGMSKKEAKAALEKQLETDKTQTVSVKVQDSFAEGTLEEYGLSYKGIDKVVKKAMDYGKKGSLWKRYWKLRKLSKEKVVFGENFVLDKEAGEAILTERAVPLANHAKNASITKTGDGFSIEKEQEGETVDVAESFAKLEKYLNNNWNHKNVSIKAKVKKEKPTVAAKDLETIQDELGSFSTDAGSGERLQNLKTGVEKLNGTVMMPGEEISVYEKTAPYDEANGYVLGASYENGKVVESYGGGICQVSTTLYNAILYAELEVVERYPHSMLVGYVAPSRDAAIAEGYKDFKFKNNYDTPVYINCGIDASNQLYFAIYGKDTREEGRTVEYESETLSTEEAGTTYQANSEAALGSMQTTSSAHTGKVARLWKIVYQNGEEVSRDVINNSTYNKSDRIIEVGTKSDNPSASALVQNAIATQDEGKIRAAIAQAR